MKKLSIILAIFVLSNSFAQSSKIKEVFKLIDKYPFKYPELVKRQFLLESDHGRSKVFKENHNCFGLRLAKKRKTNALKSRLGYAVYKNLKSNVLDRYNYEVLYMSKLSKKQYLIYLNKVYSRGDGKYVKVLQQINIDKYK